MTKVGCVARLDVAMICAETRFGRVSLMQGEQAEIHAFAGVAVGSIPAAPIREDA